MNALINLQKGSFVDISNLNPKSNNEEASPKPHVLYIMFKDLEGEADSGSSVRPQKMLRAFQNIGCDVTVLEGLQNRVLERRRKVRAVIDKLRRGETFDFCYVEPPSGPFFCPTDLLLLKVLKQKGVPIGLFYRDAYGFFPEYYSEANTIKEKIIHYMEKRDYRLFCKTCSIIYTPSASFAEVMNFPLETRPLPPASSEIDVPEPNKQDIPTGIYVGAADKWYGAYMLLDSFRRLNGKSVHARLIFICPKDQWDAAPPEYRALEKETWLDVLHISGEHKLSEEYAKADFAFLAYLHIPYNDMAMPVKLFEYITYLKPIISTNCTDKASFVEQWGIGLVSRDNPEDFAATIGYYLEHPELSEQFATALIDARHCNTWEERARTVVQDLYRYELSKSIGQDLGDAL